MPDFLRAAASATRAAVRLDAGSVTTGVWALRSARRAHHQLPRRRMEDVRLPPVPRAALGGHARIVAAVCRLAGATCLESTLVRQRWEAAHGNPRKIMVGVTAPSEGFEAHAWLEGDRVDGRFAVIHGILPVSTEW